MQVVDDLLAHDAGRNAFLRALLQKLDLKLAPVSDGVEESGILNLTPFHISSSSEPQTREIYKSLMTLSDTPLSDDDEPFIITESNDTFLVKYDSANLAAKGLDSMQDLLASLQEHHPRYPDPTRDLRYPAATLGHALGERLRLPHTAPKVAPRS